MILWPNPSPQPKRYLDQFSHFAGLTIVTERPTDHATPSVAIGRIYVVLRVINNNSLPDTAGQRGMADNGHTLLHGTCK